MVGNSCARRLAAKMTQQVKRRQSSATSDTMTTQRRDGSPVCYNEDRIATCCIRTQQILYHNCKVKVAVDQARI
jgi:hypothetical protein